MSKTKINPIKVAVDIQSEWIVEAYDYHEFEYAKSIYKFAGLKTSFKELGYIDGSYQARFKLRKT